MVIQKVSSDNPRPTQYNNMAAIAVGAAACGGVALYTAYYHFRVREVPQIRCRPVAFNKAVLERCSILKQAYWPHVLAFNAHLQLVALSLRNALRPALTFKRELVDVEGGAEHVALDWAVGENEPAPDAPTMILLHGITGDAPSMAHLAREALSRGWRAVVVIRRGHGGLKLRTPKFNPMGCVHDLRKCIATIQERYPESPLALVGWSAGSGILVRYLGEEGSKTLIKVAVGLCPGYDVEKCFSRIQPFYGRYMSGKLKSFFLKQHADTLSQVGSFEVAMNARNCNHFLESAHGLFGFASYDEFLQHSNPMVVAHQIAVPLLCINALDDPICTSENVEEQAWLFDHVPNAILATTERGSHCAYLEGVGLTSWLDRVTCDYVSAALGTMKEGIRPCASALSLSVEELKAIPKKNGYLPCECCEDQ
eukprot:comp15531_c0_seq1/m.12570 comp15531_c0_seq1/g.12570  ORF comp15531_c0_seq1/g.12570 comp15531_c0_seq1/m.12570 type:complete len:424 (-) comp15531_c0_seq1:520-1791(-)